MCVLFLNILYGLTQTVLYTNIVSIHDQLLYHRVVLRIAAIRPAVHLEYWNIRSQDYSFPGTFVPMMELSFSGPFVPWNFHFLDRSFICQKSSIPGPLTKKEQRNKQKRRPMTATVHSRYTQTVDEGIVLDV